ncbi:hypothetical protein HDV00_011960 [Rhizophlyctis rosea]|nr:hypothetical protein HDV00_011960 [Rhizophlyctis rosea]
MSTPRVNHTPLRRSPLSGNRKSPVSANKQTPSKSSTAPTTSSPSSAPPSSTKRLKNRTRDFDTTVHDLSQLKLSPLQLRQRKDNAEKYTSVHRTRRTSNFELMTDSFEEFIDGPQTIADENPPASVQPSGSPDGRTIRRTVSYSQIDGLENGGLLGPDPDTVLNRPEEVIDGERSAVSPPVCVRGASTATVSVEKWGLRTEVDFDAELKTWRRMGGREVHSGVVIQHQAPVKKRVMKRVEGRSANADISNSVSGAHRSGGWKPSDDRKDGKTWLSKDDMKDITTGMNHLCNLVEVRLADHQNERDTGLDEHGDVDGVDTSEDVRKPRFDQAVAAI